MTGGAFTVTGTVYISNSPKRHWWKPNHTSITQLANNIVMTERMIKENE